MKPELRFVAQLNRLSRALEQAADIAHDLDLEPFDTADVLEAMAFDVRKDARELLAVVAERGSAKSAT